MKLRNNKGFSLMSVIVAAGILAGLSVVFMQLMEGMNKGQNSAQSKADEIELITSIRLLLDDERHCRVSLAGDGAFGAPLTPVTFNKRSIDEDSEGLDVALYLSNQVGDARGLKKYNGADNNQGDDKSDFGKIRITSMRLIMNNGVGVDYSQSIIHKDIGQLRVAMSKKVSMNQTREIIKYFDVSVSMTTDNTGLTQILSCGMQTIASSNGCEPASSWLCSCSADTTSDHEGRVYGCVHCNSSGVIDSFWLDGFRVTSGNMSCPSSVNPPGTDPVSSYILNHN